MKGPTETVGSSIKTTRPATRSCTAGAAPLYGTCSISRPASCANSTAAMWLVVAVPEDAYESWPGRDLARRISSGTDFTGTEGCTTSTFGTVATSATPVKSPSVSYGSAGYRLGLTTCPTVTIR